MVARLALTDAAWLLIESRERPMHVGGLQLFSRPPDAPGEAGRQAVTVSLEG